MKRPDVWSHTWIFCYVTTGVNVQSCWLCEVLATLILNLDDLSPSLLGGGSGTGRRYRTGIYLNFSALELAARFKTQAVLSRNLKIAGTNPVRAMDVHVCISLWCEARCRRGLMTRWSSCTKYLKRRFADCWADLPRNKINCNVPPISLVCLFLARQPTVGQGLLIHEVSRSHTTHHSR
jgi:hypothetical protein